MSPEGFNLSNDKRSFQFGSDLCLCSLLYYLKSCFGFQISLSYKQCPPGTRRKTTIAPSNITHECIPCEAGSFTATEGQVQCMPCVEGFYADVPGNGPADRNSMCRSGCFILFFNTQANRRVTSVIKTSSSGLT